MTDTYFLYGIMPTNALSPLKKHSAFHFISSLNALDKPDASSLSFNTRMLLSFSLFEIRVSKTGLFWQFFLFENRPSATGQTRRILPPNSGELKSLGSVAVSANANVSLIPGAKNRAKYDITCCKHKVFREKRLAPKSNAKSTALFIQTTGHWGFERCVDREGRLLRPKSRGSFEGGFRRPSSK